MNTNTIIILVLWILIAMTPTTQAGDVPIGQRYCESVQSLFLSYNMGLRGGTTADEIREIINRSDHAEAKRQQKGMLRYVIEKQVWNDHEAENRLSNQIYSKCIVAMEDAGVIK